MGALAEQETLQFHVQPVHVCVPGNVVHMASDYRSVAPALPT